MKIRYFIGLLFMVALLLYVFFIVNLYAHRQAKCICLWLNEGQGPKPAVGPSAYERLTWLREEGSGNYRCTVVEPNRDFVVSGVKTVLITEDNIEIIRLNYTLCRGGRNFMQPIYFQYQTDFDPE